MGMETKIDLSLPYNLGIPEKALRNHHIDRIDDEHIRVYVNKENIQKVLNNLYSDQIGKHIRSIKITPHRWKIYILLTFRRIPTMRNSSSSQSTHPSSIRKIAVTQWFLIKSELLTLRVNWQWSLFIVLVAPLSMLLFLYLLIGRTDSGYMTYVLSGNIIMSLVTGTMLTLGQELGFLKDVRGFDYYASLPLYKVQLITAYLIRATIITIPSIMILIAVGKIAFNVQIVIHISLFVIVFLSGMSLAGLGAFIGIYS